MSNSCKMCGKKVSVGNQISHSNIKTKRTYRPNLITKKVYITELKKKVLVKLCAKCLKTFAKRAA